MTSESRTDGTMSWWESSGIGPIFRIPSLARQLPCLGLAFAGIVATFVLGSVLDGAWRLGNGTVAADSIDQFILARQLDRIHVDAEGSAGVFSVWRAHEQQHLAGMLLTAVPGMSSTGGTPLGAFAQAQQYGGPIRHFMAAFYGCWWLLRNHIIFAVLFFGGALIIWSVAGGGICRLAAVQFAREELLSIGDAVRFVISKIWGGFVLAPLIPMAFVAAILVLLVLGGVVLRIPWLGDVLGGLLFFLAILGGAAVAFLLLGFLLGGSLLWPSVATEGSDAFDAFQRSLSYSLWRLWRTLFYGALTTVYAGACWLLINVVAFLALRVARAAVSFGTAPFGWWERSSGEHGVSKLQLLWPMVDPHAWHTAPDWSQLGTMEHVSAALIWLWIGLLGALVWAFLASFYFSGSTVIYFLLRRDVDFTDMDEVYSDEDALAVVNAPSSGSAGTPSAAG